MKPIVLASSSPRRLELLAQSGFECIIAPADINETPRINEPPTDYVLRLALEKAQHIQPKYPQHVIVAADTSVVLGNQIFGKPENEHAAYQMWQQLSAQTHTVQTAVAVLYQKHLRHFVVSTAVDFCLLTPADMRWYWQTGEPADKAGGYAIQGAGTRFVRCIQGSYSNVVGLPLAETIEAIHAVKLQP